MAEEVHGTVSGGNGERLQLQVGTKSIGLTTRDLIPILLLLGGVIGGYLIYTNVATLLNAALQQHATMQTLLHDNQVKFLQAVQRWQDLVDQQTATIRRLLEIHEYNQDRAPENRLPLDVALERVPPPTHPPP